MVDQVTFPPSVGGSGRTYTNDSNPDTGMFNGGHRINFFPMLSDTVAAAGYVAQYAQKIDGAKDDADRAESARGYVEAVADVYQKNILDAFRAIATLDLDFARGLYRVDDGTLTQTTNAADVLTVSRSTPKSAIGPNGKLRTLGINTLVRAWDSGVTQGVLIEEGRTNLLLWSEDFTQSTSASASSVNSSVMAAPDGNNTADKIIEDNTTASHQVYKSPNDSFSEGDSLSACVYVKAGERSTCRVFLFGSNISGSSIDFDLENGVQLSGSGRYQHIGNGWYRLSVTAVAVSAGSDARLYIRLGTGAYLGDGASGIYAWGAQLEIGKNVSSYVKTEGAPVARAMDGAPQRVLGNEFNKTQGTLILNINAHYYLGNQERIIELGSGGNNRISIYCTASNNGISAFVRDGMSVAPFDSVSSAGVIDGVQATVKIAFTYNIHDAGTDLVLAVNGDIYTLSSSAKPEISDIIMGWYLGDGQINGYYKNVTYIPSLLTSSNLSEVTL